MRSRFFPVIPAVLFALFVFSCNQFVNLGDENRKSYADNTEGLPDEFYEEDNADNAASDGSYDDWNEDTADSEYYDDKQSDDNGSYDEGDDTDTADNNSDTEPEAAPDPDDCPGESPDESNAPSYIFPESDPFPEGFSNAECECGEDSHYDPVCCNGVILVFNSCFAHCYAIHSGNKICSVYRIGLCEGYEQSDDDIDNIDDDIDEMPEDDTEDNDQDLENSDDNDSEGELPDSDEDASAAESGCGCRPEEDAAIFSCGEHSYLITACLANCLCEEPQQLFTDNH